MRVKVRSLEESLAIEGPFMDDAYGLAVPETPEAIALREQQVIERAAAEAATAAAATKAAEEAAVVAARADRRRLNACRRQGIGPDDCPVPVVMDVVPTAG